MKNKLLLIMAAALSITGAESLRAADDDFVKPGERLIVDDRVDEAPQLENRIFKEPKIVTKKELADDPEPAPVNYDATPDHVKAEEMRDEMNDDSVVDNVDIEVDTGYGRDADDIADDIEDLNEELDDIN